MFTNMDVSFIMKLPNNTKKYRPEDLFRDTLKEYFPAITDDTNVVFLPPGLEEIVAKNNETKEEIEIKLIGIIRLGTIDLSIKYRYFFNERLNTILVSRFLE